MHTNVRRVTACGTRAGIAEFCRLAPVACGYGRFRQVEPLPPLMPATAGIQSTSLPAGSPLSRGRAEEGNRPNRIRSELGLTSWSCLKLLLLQPGRCKRYPGVQG